MEVPYHRVISARFFHKFSIIVDDDVSSPLRRYFRANRIRSFFGASIGTLLFTYAFCYTSLPRFLVSLTISTLLCTRRSYRFYSGNKAKWNNTVCQAMIINRSDQWESLENNDVPIVITIPLAYSVDIKHKLDIRSRCESHIVLEKFGIRDKDLIFFFIVALTQNKYMRQSIL